MKKIAVFASGSGTNAENLINHFNKTLDYKVCIVLSNNKEAFVLKRSERLGIPFIIFNKEQLSETPGFQGESVQSILDYNNIDVIILAGFLLMIPQKMILRYPGRIINIHPALLPKYGGKGMHGMNVHIKIIEEGEKQSGITIHLVDELYDHGTILFQSTCDIIPEDTPEDLAAKIHTLEQKYFPIEVEKYLNTVYK
ncbi:MAG: phosphoribosylglycinamide formyltransferase [Bacteroidales bacterium]|nr:phosphoribosylglycinamide formyltransferase [Bacteroidales bacterium]